MSLSHLTNVQGTSNGTDWLPTIRFLGGPGTQNTYDIQLGKYTRLGDLLFFVLNVSILVKGTETGLAVIDLSSFPNEGKSDMKIASLPFSVDLNVISPMPVTYSGIIPPDQNIIIFASYDSVTGNLNILDDTYFSNGSQIAISGFYYLGVSA